MHGIWRFDASGPWSAWQPAPGLAQSIALAIELDDFGSVDEAVDEGDDAVGGAHPLRHRIAAVTGNTIPLKLSTLWPPSAWRRMSFETFGAGTITDARDGPPSVPSGTSSESPGPRETGQHRTPPTAGDHRVSPATAALAASHLRPPGASIPPWCACLRPNLSSGAFGLITAPLTASTDGSSASRRVSPFR